ncbi:MAG: putative manganese-dependent inorganic diphosphatase [Ruminococcaceae bacterium]|nr:putative manganese-dependent inorganic diphosphatase [Oscillospiraceae bacterium]
MEKIYVVGHQNPDTDSICSAIGYAALRHSLGNENYIAARLGNVSDETGAILEYFDVKAPKLITNLRTQVSDIEFDTPPTLEMNVTIKKAWETLKDNKISAAPIVDAEGKLVSMITSGDIASYVMTSLYDFGEKVIPTFDITELFEVSIYKVCGEKEIQYFHLDDYIDDVKEVILKSRYRSYPVLDEERVVVGTIGRFHLIRHNKKKVVLVDHNELAQSVPGLSQAEILEIIDHHRLADIQTFGPIFFRNEPLGSTATIIAKMYDEQEIIPDKKIAGLLAAAIISDTVMFKSPTCTPTDVKIAKNLAKIADVSLDHLGEIMFSSSAVAEKPVKKLMYSDFKEFLIAGYKLGIGQITCLNSDVALKRKDEFMKEMESKKNEAGYDFIIIMFTDVLKEGTHLLFLGDVETINQAYDVIAKDNEVFLPEVMSRKKQIVPRLSELWG